MKKKNLFLKIFQKKKIFFFFFFFFFRRLTFQDVPRPPTALYDRRELNAWEINRAEARKRDGSQKKNTKAFQTVERMDNKINGAWPNQGFLPHRGERGRLSLLVAQRERGHPSPFLPPTVKKKEEDGCGQDENRPVPIDHREDGNLSRSPQKACISILTLETRAPSKDRREGWSERRGKEARRGAPRTPGHGKWRRRTRRRVLARAPCRISLSGTRPCIQPLTRKNPIFNQSSK